jgi:hypothetical protein
MGNQVSTGGISSTIKATNPALNPTRIALTLGIGYLIYNKKTRKFGIAITAVGGFMMWRYLKAFSG